MKYKEDQKISELKENFNNMSLDNVEVKSLNYWIKQSKDCKNMHFRSAEEVELFIENAKRDLFTLAERASNNNDKFNAEKSLNAFKDIIVKVVGSKNYSDNLAMNNLTKILNKSTSLCLKQEFIDQVESLIDITETLCLIKNKKQKTEQSSTNLENLSSNNFAEKENIRRESPNQVVRSF